MRLFVVFVKLNFILGVYVMLGKGGFSFIIVEFLYVEKSWYEVFYGKMKFLDRDPLLLKFKFTDLKSREL